MHCGALQGKKAHTTDDCYILKALIKNSKSERDSKRSKDSKEHFTITPEIEAAVCRKIMKNKRKREDKTVEELKNFERLGIDDGDSSVSSNGTSSL